jgi:hypothetical protein
MLCTMARIGDCKEYLGRISNSEFRKRGDEQRVVLSEEGFVYGIKNKGN